MEKHSWALLGLWKHFKLQVRTVNQSTAGSKGLPQAGLPLGWGGNGQFRDPWPQVPGPIN